MVELFTNRGDPDQTLHSAASDLGLHCLPVTLLGFPDCNGLNLFIHYTSSSSSLSYCKIILPQLHMEGKMSKIGLLEFIQYYTTESPFHWSMIDWLCWGLTTRQPLRVILCRLPEKGRKEIEERVEEMKERDREERGTGKKVKKQKK